MILVDWVWGVLLQNNLGYESTSYTPFNNKRHPQEVRCRLFMHSTSTMHSHNISEEQLFCQDSFHKIYQYTVSMDYLSCTSKQWLTYLCALYCYLLLVKIRVYSKYLILTPLNTMKRHKLLESNFTSVCPNLHTSIWQFSVLFALCVEFYIMLRKNTVTPKILYCIPKFNRYERPRLMKSFHSGVQVQLLSIIISNLSLSSLLNSRKV